MTASMRGVVPMRAVIGAKKAGNKFKLKNIAPVTSRVTGVIKAATPQPKRCESYDSGIRNDVDGSKS